VSALIVAAAFVVIINLPSSNLSNDLNATPDETYPPFELVSTEIITPSSYDEVFESLQNRAANASIYGLPIDMFNRSSYISVRDIYVGTGGPGLSEGDFSQSDPQSPSESEAGTVKTDGKNIYAIDFQSINIIEAKGKKTKEISSIWIELGMPKGLYILNNRLVVMIEHGNPLGSPNGLVSYVAVYDISDPANLQLVGLFGQDGTLVDSQLIDGMLYMVSVYNVLLDNAAPGAPQTFIPNSYEGDLTSPSSPVITDHPIASESIRMAPEDLSPQFTVVSAIDIEQGERVSEFAMLGYARTIHMDQNHLFLAAPIYPNLSNIETRISRLTFYDGSISLTASRVVDGTLINRFSLDEYAGYLRVALTTCEETTSEFEMVYSTIVVPKVPPPVSLLILDDNLDTVGSIVDVDTGERIYTARFMGEVGYLVTYKETGPLYPLDLSDPTNPQIVDALEMPCFSQCLQPYSEGMLLSFGLDTTITDNFNARIKLSMFDVSDPFNVSEIHSESIVAYHSEGLQDYKALYVNPEKNIIAFEVVCFERKDSTWKVVPARAEGFYQIYGYDKKTGFYLRAEIPILDLAADTRALSIGNDLYIVNSWGISVYNLNTLKEIAQVALYDYSTYPPL